MHKAGVVYLSSLFHTVIIDIHYPGRFMADSVDVWQQVGRRGNDGDAASCMSLGQTATGADLGSSSKYLNDSLKKCPCNFVLKAYCNHVFIVTGTGWI